MIGRVLVDPPASAAWNMAADQVLLDAVSAGGPPVLRLYRWEVPTLSLGYFQSVSQRQSHPASAALPLVRRSTGGGAIVHDRELTYSLTMPIADRARREVEQFYRAVHGAIRPLFQKWGIDLTRFADTIRREGQELVASKQERFLCFQRRTAEDLTLAGYKVVGSAQRRAANAVLQHGSVLLEASRAAPELPGINDLSVRRVNMEALIEAFPERLDVVARSIAPVQPIAWERSRWRPEEKASAERIATERFSQPTWNRRRP